MIQELVHFMCERWGYPYTSLLTLRATLLDEHEHFERARIRRRSSYRSRPSLSVSECLVYGDLKRFTNRSARTHNA